jgi:hypothetical protein
MVVDDWQAPVKTPDVKNWTEPPYAGPNFSSGPDFQQ